MKIIFIYLTAFSRTGGIEKFNRAFMKAAFELSSENNIRFKALSLHDVKEDARYINSNYFRGYGGHKLSFVLSSLIEGLLSDLVILAHINLAPIGVLIKKFRGNVPVILITHGVDVWYKLSKIKLEMIQCADNILSVSNFTRQKLIENHDATPQKISVFPNTIDPFFNIPSSFEKPKYLMENLGINEKTNVILTVSRLSTLDKFKGYDKVIQVLPDIKRAFPDVRYIVVGKGDIDEINRIEKLIDELELSSNVILTGYVGDYELQDYYMISDVFVLPSKGEGFGIVLIEALACGNNVIAGSKDASSEVLFDGALGTLVNPDNLSEIKDAIIGTLTKKPDEGTFDKNKLQGIVLEEYGFSRFKERLSITLKSFTAH